MPEFVVDSLDTVEESIRSAYVEKDGKFNLDADKYAEVKAQGLKNKNREIIGKLNEAKTGLKKFEKFAEFDETDLEELLELHANKDKLNEKGKEPSAADAERLAQLEKQHKKALDRLTGEKTAVETRAAELEKENKHFKLTVPIRDVALKAGVIPEDLKFVMMDVSSRFSLSDEGKIVVLDEDGQPDDMTPQKFFELYKVQFPKFFAPSGAGGSGAPSTTTSANGTKAMTRDNFRKLPPQQQSDFARQVREGKATLVD